MISWLIALGCQPEPTCCDSSPPDSEAAWTQPEAGVVELMTQDDVKLVADYHPVDQQGAPGVVLLHMNPSGGFHRGNWPAEFITALNGAGYAVINVDRRGSGDSEGVARQAYTGEKGKWDVEACALRLQEDGYGELVLIGASNGTTSALDYSAWAGSQDLPVPTASVYMTGGGYTESQTSMEELPEMPVQFTYSTAEKAWSEQQMPLDPGSWQFDEYADGDHGTKMFEADPSVTQDIVDFLGASL